MSFLQINNANPSEKRPFRLSDIQDIWNGIKSLFKAISGQQFRIISGFDLVTVNGLEQYSAGVVWYNGNLYEYDPALYGRITPYDDVFFSKGAIDNRTWEGGAIQPFAYKYVCGTNVVTDDVDRELIPVDTFARHVERYKSFLGNGSVSTSKLADQSVTVAKIDRAARVPIFDRAGVGNITVSGDMAIEQYVTAAGLPRLVISANAPSTVTIDTATTEDSPAFICTQVDNYSPTDIKVGLSGGAFGWLGDTVFPKHISSAVPSTSNLLLVKTKAVNGDYFYDVFSCEPRIVSLE
jgi:hypothetical protein